MDRSTRDLQQVTQRELAKAIAYCELPLDQLTIPAAREIVLESMLSDNPEHEVLKEFFEYKSKHYPVSRLITQDLDQALSKQGAAGSLPRYQPRVKTTVEQQFCKELFDAASPELVEDHSLLDVELIIQLQKDVYLCAISNESFSGDDYGLLEFTRKKLAADTNYPSWLTLSNERVLKAFKDEFAERCRKRGFWPIELRAINELQDTKLMARGLDRLLKKLQEQA